MVVLKAGLWVQKALTRAEKMVALQTISEP